MSTPPRSPLEKRDTGSLLGWVGFSAGLAILLLAGLALALALTSLREYLETDWGITFPTPLPFSFWWVMLGLGIALLLLYFLKLRRQSMTVSSTFLWKKSIEDLHVNSLFQWLKKNFLLRGFFKDRGYEDSTELTKNEIAQLPARPPAMKFVYDGEELFDKPTTAKLKKEKLLHEAGQYLETHPQGLVVIAAYTDMKGDSEKDRTLTQARATVARKYLVEHYRLNDKRIKTLGLGKSDEIGGTSQLHILVFSPGQP